MHILVHLYAPTLNGLVVITNFIISDICLKSPITSKVCVKNLFSIKIIKFHAVIVHICHGKKVVTMCCKTTFFVTLAPD